MADENSQANNQSNDNGGGGVAANVDAGNGQGGAGGNGAADAGGNGGGAGGPAANQGGGAALVDNGQGGADKGGAAAAAAAPAAFPENWREQMATVDGKVDEKALKTLQRYQSPTAAAQALLDLRAKVSAGELRKPLGENPTPEEIKQFRADNGIPETVVDYAKLAVPEGVVIGEQDKPLIDNFMKAMLDKNISPAAAKAAVAAYYENVDILMGQTEEADANYLTTNEDALRNEWGPEFRKNMNAISNLVSSLPEGVPEMLIHARGPDGRLLGDNALFRKALAQIALDLNPAASVVPGTSGDPAKGLEDQIKGFEKMMNDDIKAWHKNADAQKKYGELLEIRAKMQAKGA